MSKSISPWISPNTNGFNHEYDVQCRNPVVETSAGEMPISKRPFAVANCSAWLLSKESPVSQIPSSVTLQSVTVSHPTLLSSLYYPAHARTHAHTHTH